MSNPILEIVISYLQGESEVEHIRMDDLESKPRLIVYLGPDVEDVHDLSDLNREELIRAWSEIAALSKILGGDTLPSTRSASLRSSATYCLKAS